MIRSWLQSRLAREGAVKASSTALAMALAFGSSVLLARTLPPDALGGFVMILSLVQVGVMLADAGIGQATTRFVACSSDPDSFRQLVRRALAARAVVALVLVAVYAASAPLLLPRLLPAPLARDVRWPLLLVVLCKAGFLLWPALERGRRRWLAEGSLLVAEAAGIVALYGWALIRGGVPVQTLLRGLVMLYAVLGVLTALKVARVLWGRQGAGAEATASPAAAAEPPPGLRRLLLFALPLLANGSFFFALVTLDRIALGAMRPKAELAVYFVAVNLATAGRVGFAVLEQVLYSHLAATCRPDSGALGSVYRRVFALFALGALAMAVVGAGLGQVVIPAAYGSGYAASVPPFVLMLVVLGVRVLSIPASLFLIVVFQRPRSTQEALAAGFVVCVLLWFCLIPRLGIDGAVLSALGAFAVASALQLRTVARLGLRPDPRFLRWYVPLAVTWTVCAAGAHVGVLPMAAFWGAEVAVALALGLAVLRPEAATAAAPLLRPEAGA